jgi:hypothetical protein
MGSPALEYDLSNEVEATSAVWIRIRVREWEGLTYEPKGARVKPEEPSAKIPRPVEPGDSLLMGEVKERAFKGVKLQGKGQCLSINIRVGKRVEGPVALWTSSVARPSPEAGNAQRRWGGEWYQRVDCRGVRDVSCQAWAVEPVRNVGEERHKTKPPGQARPVG